MRQVAQKAINDGLLDWRVVVKDAWREGLFDLKSKDHQEMGFTLCEKAAQVLGENLRDKAWCKGCSFEKKDGD